MKDIKRTFCPWAKFALGRVFEPPNGGRQRGQPNMNRQGRDDFERVVWRGCGCAVTAMFAIAVAGFALIVILAVCAVYGIRWW